MGSAWLDQSSTRTSARPVSQQFSICNSSLERLEDFFIFFPMARLCLYACMTSLLALSGRACEKGNAACAPISQIILNFIH